MIPWAPRALFGARRGRVPRKLRKRSARWLAHVGLPPSTPRPYPQALAVHLAVPVARPRNHWKPLWFPLFSTTPLTKVASLATLLPPAQFHGCPA